MLSIDFFDIACSAPNCNYVIYLHLSVQCQDMSHLTFKVPIDVELNLICAIYQLHTDNMCLYFHICIVFDCLSTYCCKTIFCRTNAGVVLL